MCLIRKRKCVQRNPSPVSEEFEEPVQLSDLNCTGLTKLKIPTLERRSDSSACSPIINVKAQATADPSKSFFCIILSITKCHSNAHR